MGRPADLRPGLTPVSGPAAADLVATLQRSSSPSQLDKVRRRLGPGEQAIGLRMRDVFDISRSAVTMPLPEVAELFASPWYEARLSALCVLDLRARALPLGDPAGEELYDLYLGHHDRITTWDMVDRAAPAVVGRFLIGRSCAPLHDLARADDPLRRRTAMTAPLAFVRWGQEAELAELLRVAAVLHADPDPLVHLPVGIALKHAGARDPRAVVAFLDRYATAMPRAAVRGAADKLDPADRARFVRGRS